MSSLICFPNKLAKPAPGVSSEFAFSGSDGSEPAEDGAAGEGGADSMLQASCSPDPGSEAAGECGKRLSDSLWASEDLGCSSEIRQDVPVSRGSPEWSGAADSQRAISLDASECLAELSNLSLVRSTALEDLTSIGDRSAWVDPGEESQDGAAADGASGSRKVSPDTQSAPHIQNPPDPHSEDVHPVQSSRNISEEEVEEEDSLSTKMPCGMATENSSSDSSVHRASYSKPDISNDSDMRSGVAQTTGTAELQKTPPHAARKSMVPVPVVKGLFAVTFTSIRVPLS